MRFGPPDGPDLTGPVPHIACVLGARKAVAVAGLRVRNRIMAAAEALATRNPTVIEIRGVR